jgi:hypothetical protein
MCKDVVNRDSTCQSFSEDSALKIEVFRFPVSRPDEVSSRPDAHLSTIPSVRTTCHPVRTPGRPASSVQTLHCVEEFLFKLYPSRRLSSPSRYPLVLDQSQILSKF